MNFLKKVSVFFIILTLLFSFTSCRQKVADVAVKNYDGVVLTYYSLYDDSEVIDPVISKFIASHPGLKINYRKFSDFKEYQKTVLDEMANGEGPDIFSMNNDWFRWNTKKLVPMPLSAGELDGFDGTFVDVAHKDLVFADTNEVEHVYGVPKYIDTLALYYNKAQFEDALPQKGRPSVTWEGIAQDVVALTKTDNSFDRFEVSGIAMGGANSVSRAADILFLLFLQHDVKFYTPDFTEAVFAGSHALEALKYYMSFSDPTDKSYTWSDVVDASYDGKEVEAFARGDVSMILGYSFTYNQIVSSINRLKSEEVSTIEPDSIRITYVPQLIDPAVSKEKRVTYANYFADAVSRNSKNPDLAWQFLVELTSRENLEYYFSKTKKPTSRRDLIEDQRLDPIYGVFVNQVGFAESYPVFDIFEYQSIFSDLISHSLSEGVSLSFLKNAQDLVTKLLPKEGLIILPSKNEQVSD